MHNKTLPNLAIGHEESGKILVTRYLVILWQHSNLCFKSNNFNIFLQNKKILCRNYICPKAMKICHKKNVGAIMN